jgi:hypothetical protein
MPPRPRRREVPRALARIEAAGAGREFVERDVDRRGQARARGLGENADAAMVVLERARRGPGVEAGVDRDTGLPLAGQLPRDRGSERVRAVDQQRVDVRLDRVQVGREEEARTVALLLVDVHDDLRVPQVVERVDGQLRFNLRERVPIAVVVVARVVVV